MAQAHLYLVLSVAIVMVFLASHSDACFITNCPPAGKRSLMPALASSQFHKECTRCGPALSGRCFGPSICCSPMTGCNIGGAMAARCALEAYSPQLCSNSGQACGVNGKGICALNATCCTSGDSNVDGPLLTPCHCSGSMKYIHLQCLVKCIETRNSDHCEVCLGKFTQIETCTYRPSFGKFLHENPDIRTELIFALLVIILLFVSMVCQLFKGLNHGCFVVQLILQGGFIIFYTYYMLYFYFEWLEDNVRIQVINNIRTVS
ncbi:hypothetical protein TYRP_008151 [Tyrophagus putrescentiae]|nr:hypothetical protein TYRP_008151 [Tyrophagus putrescentiae]